MSRNLFEELQTVATICAALPHLRSLKIRCVVWWVFFSCWFFVADCSSGNRFSSLKVERVPGQPSPFEGVTSLEISNTYLTWDEVYHPPHILSTYSGGKEATY